jgi:hypothetical protein
MKFLLAKQLVTIFAWANTLWKEHPIYTGEKGRILGKRYGFKIQCYWEHPGEHIENLGNNLGTW